MRPDRLGPDARSLIRSPGPELHELFPRDALLTKLEADWVVADAEGRSEDARSADKAHRAVKDASDDKEAWQAYEGSMGRAFVRGPTPAPDGDPNLPPGHRATPQMAAAQDPQPEEKT